MKKLKLYLETSVWNFLFADDAPEKKIATEKLFRQIDDEKYEVFISRVVTTEIDDTKGEKKLKLLSVIEKYKPVYLEEDENTIELTRAYLESGILSDAHLDDLIHVAVATVNDMHILVSWNLKHLVKHRIRVLVNAVNKRMGYREIDICRPEEVLEYED